MTATKSAGPCRLITWTGPDYEIIQQLGFHKSDLKAVLDLPFPQGAVVREPITELTTLTPKRMMTLSAGI